jgi:murein DD-endopeptidase MepM/ murein hydrolase activator NlpD
MMKVMMSSLTTARALLAVSLTGLAVSSYLWLWPGTAAAPRWLPEPPPSTLGPIPAYATTARTVEVKSGETLARAFVRAGIEPRLANKLVADFGRSGAELRKIRTGATIEITWNARHEPLMIRYEATPWLAFGARFSGSGWRVGRAETVPEVRVEAVRGVVQRSLFDAIEKSGESAKLVLEMVEIFSSDFDFTADTRTGDRFRLLVEKRYAGEDFVDYGRILVAQYVSGNKTHTGVGFQQGRYAHYDPSGQSLKKTFLKSPLEFSRVTSGFTYARPHPILGGVRPHLAIDYGIQVHLRHRSGYETQYNHLSKLAPGVRPGARVRQKDVIGNVGATGLATGPHLDYRVAKNGVFVNPLSEKFLPGEPIPAASRADFQRHARELLAQLEAKAGLQ